MIAFYLIVLICATGHVYTSQPVTGNQCCPCPTTPTPPSPMTSTLPGTTAASSPPATSPAAKTTTITITLPKTVTSTPPDCVISNAWLTKTFKHCTFEWSSWDCFTCCNGGLEATRTRDLCCSGTFYPTDFSQCYSDCGLDYTHDADETKSCSDVCSCTTSTMSTWTSSTAWTDSSTAWTDSTSPTAATSPTTAWTDSTSPTAATSPTTVKTSSSTLRTLTTAMTPLSQSMTSPLTSAKSPSTAFTCAPLCTCPSTRTPSTSTNIAKSSATYPSIQTQRVTSPQTSTTSTRLTQSSTASVPVNPALSRQPNKGARVDSSFLCYKARDDVYHCGLQCIDDDNWDECVRSCSKDLYKTFCKIVSLSLFLLGLIVGSLVTCFVNFLCTRKKRALSRAVSPESLGSPGGGLVKKDPNAANESVI